MALFLVFNTWPGQMRGYLEGWIADREFGTDTRGQMQLADLDFDDPHKALGNACVPAARRFLRWTSQYLPSDLKDFTLVDYGCGKGRVLLYMRKLNFKSIIGIEFSPQLCKIAKDNMALVAKGSGDRRLSVIEGDAAAFDIPSGPCVLYFFNPFQRDISATIAHKIDDALKREDRPIYIAWVNVTEGAAPFYEAPFLEPIAGRRTQNPPPPSLARKGTFVVFKSRERGAH